MIPKKENWRNDCRHCPHFDQCRSNKSAEECKAFLDKEITKSLLKTSEDYVYYVITRKGEAEASFSSIDLLEDYIKNHPNIFQVIYRKESMINGKIRYGSFHVYHI